MREWGNWDRASGAGGFDRAAQAACRQPVKKKETPAQGEMRKEAGANLDSASWVASKLVYHTCGFFVVNCLDGVDG